MLSQLFNEQDILGMPTRLLFVRYLMASYLYYELNSDTPWSDSQFDYACKRLVNEWDTFEHPHKSLTSCEALVAGTGYQIKEWPTIVRSCAILWADSYHKPVESPRSV